MMRHAFLFRWSLAITCAVGWGAADAIVVRHDRDDSAYRALGQRHPEAVSILPDGTGVLITPRWVLTAAHVVQGAGDALRVQLDEETVDVRRTFVHPEWKEMAHDIALIQLAKPVTDVTPVALYHGNDEVGKVVTFVGRGDFGSGLTGPETMDRIKRGATNRVVDADEDWLFFRFERGDGATDLEGVSGPGDSGGPALLTVEGKTYTLGVSVFADGDEGPGRYGVLEGYTRVSTHLDWIEKVLTNEEDGSESRRKADSTRIPEGRRASSH